MKNLVMFLGAVLLVGAAACSSSSNNGSSSGGLSCPTAGTKYCPNDTATTQQDADACAKCLSQYQAFGACAEAQGESTTVTCDSSGNDVQPSSDVTTKVTQNCASQESAFITCLSAAESDGGS
jgi:hypothetical protein